MRAGADSRFSFHELHRGGGEVADFRSAVSRLKRTDIDVAGVMLHPGQISQFYRQLSEQRVSIPSFGSDALESSREVESSGAAIEGAFFVNHDVSSAFREEYIRRHGSDDLIAFAAWGHDLVVVLREALASKASVLQQGTFQEIEQALQQKLQYAGVTGLITFVSTPQGDRYFKFSLRVKQAEPVHANREFVASAQP